MGRFLVRKDVFAELIEKGYGKRDLSKLQKRQITDKNGHKRTVWVKGDVQENTSKQPKQQEGLSDEKRVKYEEMLEKVKSGPDERALFVQGEFLTKQEAIEYLDNLLGNNTNKTTPKKNTDEEKFEVAIENNKRNISEENKIDDLSEKVEFSNEELDAIQDAADSINYKPGAETALFNQLYTDNRNMYIQLMDKNQKIWASSKQAPKTFSGFDLIGAKLIKMGLKPNKNKKNKFANMSAKELVDKYKRDLPLAYVETKDELLEKIESTIQEQKKYKERGSILYKEQIENLLNAAKEKIDDVAKELKLQ